MTEDEILEHLLLFGQPPYAAHVWDYYWWTANAFVTSQRRSVHSRLVSQRCPDVMCALAALESDLCIEIHAAMLAGFGGRQQRAIEPPGPGTWKWRASVAASLMKSR